MRLSREGGTEQVGGIEQVGGYRTGRLGKDEVGCGETHCRQVQPPPISFLVILDCPGPGGDGQSLHFPVEKAVV